MPPAPAPPATGASFAAAALLLAAAVLTGCKVDQAKEIGTYRKVLDAGTVPATQPFAAGEPLSLEQALALTNVNAEQLAIGGETYLQAVIDRQRSDFHAKR